MNYELIGQSDDELNFTIVAKNDVDDAFTIKCDLSCFDSCIYI